MALQTDTAAPSTRRSRLALAVVAVVVAAMVAMWGYVVYLAFFEGRQGPPDELDAPAFAAGAQERCGEALDVVATLPVASESPSAEARAEVIDEANEAFAAMLVDLETMAPEGEDGVLVTEWLADWRTYLGDRARYAVALREDPDARLLVSPKAGQHITEYLDAFAADNDMPACATPTDL